MNTENKNEAKPAGGEKKELTPGQLQKRKKMILFPLFFLLFTACMWFIFAPSGDKNEEGRDGFNTELPTPKESGIISDKRDAYQQEAMRNKEQEKMRSLQDFAFALGEGTTDEREIRTASAPVEYDEEPTYTEGNSKPQGNSRSSTFRSSANHYQDINRQLGEWYNEPATKADTEAQHALESRIQELERQLEEKSAAGQQLDLIEKSYAIAAKYMPAQAQTETAAPAPVVNTAGAGRKTIPQPVSGVARNVVSLLSAPLSDSAFVEEYTKPRNRGFHTAAGNEKQAAKNSIAACISQTVTVADGQEVQIRLMEAMQAGDMVIPENTIISGSARLAGERMNVEVNYIGYGGNIIPVEMVVFDLDGHQGISVPGSEELSAVKEVAANMGTSMGSSITITSDAKSQLLADLGRSAIQGASQYVGKKMRTVRVTLKAGHRILLLPPMQ
jgi:conjugative transposon TraM protein